MTVENLESKIATLKSLVDKDEALFNGNHVAFIKQMSEKIEENGGFDDLTEGQINYINGLYKRNVGVEDFTHQFLSKLKNDADFKEKFECCLIYYNFITDEPYYGAYDIKRKYGHFLKEGEPFFLRENHVDKMMNNKYFMKVWEAYKAKPLFEEGSLAVVRSNAKAVDIPRQIRMMARPHRSPWETEDVIEHRSKKQALARKILMSLGTIEETEGRNYNHFLLNETKDTPVYILATDPFIPVSSAKGSKLYTVIPLGNTSKTTLCIEERYLKKYRG